ncbi:MAG: hypothetical protein ACLQBB_02825 [Solirubrobacteraceae bacterium]
MSAPAGQSDRAVRRVGAQRRRQDGRSRRADAGAVTEMARALLRDAREAEVGRRHDVARLARIEPAGPAEPAARAA